MNTAKITRKIFLVVMALLLVLAFSCEDLFSIFDDNNNSYKTNTHSESSNSSTTETNTEENNTSTTTSIDKSYWGTWIQMDTGDEYYIDSSSIRTVTTYSDGSFSYGSSIASNVNGYSLDGENVLAKGNIRYFRKGGGARDFSLTVTGFSDSKAARAISIGKQGISGHRENKENKADNETETSDANGTLNFTGAVAGDTQTITVDDTTSAEVTPQFSGENLGTIPIVESGTYGFKTTYEIDSDALGFCYGNYYKTYTLTLKLNNIGSATCATSVYTISWDDSKLQKISGALTGNFSSIDAGDSKEVTLELRYAELNEEYVDVPISVKIEDSGYLRTWEDSVTLRFYRGTVSLKVNSRNFDENSNATLKGFLIYPDGRSKRFTVNAGETQTVLVPWSNSDYILAFSGADSSNEIAYSFGFSSETTLADLSGVWQISEINAYEPNDSTSTAHKVSDLSSPVKAYLKSGDIDFYTINNSSVELKFAPVTYNAHSRSDSMSDTAEYNNGDGKINPGEVIKMDVLLQNITDSKIYGITAMLSTSSNYVTITDSTKKYGDIEAGYYKTAYDANGRNSDSGYSYTSYYFGDCSQFSTSYGFAFTVSSDCPVDTTIPFTLAFTDSSGNAWTDSFNLKVEKTGADIVYNAYELSDSTSLSESNNGDGKVTPGESIEIDIQLQNKGTSRALGITATLSTSSNYVSITTPTKSYGDIESECYKTAYDANDRNSNSGYSHSSYYYYDYSQFSTSYGFAFTVSPDCPVGTELPFKITATDSSGNTWADDLSIPVN